MRALVVAGPEGVRVINRSGREVSSSFPEIGVLAHVMGSRCVVYATNTVLAAHVAGGCRHTQGMTTRDIKEHLSEVYGADVSPALISQVTDVVSDGRVVLAIAQVSVHLSLQRRLQHNLGQLLHQPALTTDGHPISLSTLDQFGHHLPIHHRRNLLLRRVPALISHHLHYGQLHRKNGSASLFVKRSSSLLRFGCDGS
ncbi:transposase [Saccharopolyspora pogona]|uniref:transposase n=1 Tax=Saccharopolyspora pogona TaxID=333966 RepID=UPI001687F9A4